jgi:hypothetical protein
MFKLITRLFVLMAKVEKVMRVEEDVVNQGNQDVRRAAAWRVYDAYLELSHHCTVVCEACHGTDRSIQSLNHAHAHAMRGMDLALEAIQMSNDMQAMTEVESMVGGVVLSF